MGEYGEYVNRGLRSVDGIANLVISKRNYPENYYQSYLIVEGTTDKELYETYIDINRCEITTAEGKDKVKEVLLILERCMLPGVLAIVDADFDVLEEKLPATQNLLFTDTHDLETMIIKSTALEKVLSKFGSADKIAAFKQKYGKDVRTTLIECGTHIGYLRWISLREGLALSFEDLDFNKFVNKGELTIDVLKLIKAVKERSYNTEIDKSRKHTIREHDTQKSMNQLKNDLHDPWYVCCGHDLACILAVGLQKAIGTHSTQTANQELVEKWLHLAYEHFHFHKTQLFASIQVWEKANAPFVILNKES